MTETTTAAADDTEAAAQALAAQLHREADEHERLAEQATDRFQAAAHRGAAEDLRARAAQTLSETETGRRLAEEQAARERLLTAAKNDHEAALARYKELADEVPKLVDTAVADVLAAADRLRAHAIELAAAKQNAETSAWAVNTYGGHAWQVPDLIDAAIRELTIGGHARARVFNGARANLDACTTALADQACRAAQQTGTGWAEQI